MYVSWMDVYLRIWNTSEIILLTVLCTCILSIDPEASHRLSREGYHLPHNPPCHSIGYPLQFGGPFLLHGVYGPARRDAPRAILADRRRCWRRCGGRKLRHGVQRRLFG